MQELRQTEQHLQQVSTQRQHYSRQILEYDNALDELKGVKEAFQIVGSVMVKKDAKAISVELEKKKEIAELRLTTITKQEKELQTLVKKLQDEVTDELDKE